MLITSNQIKAARGLLEWTQEQLANHASLTIDQVRRFEGGKSQTVEILEAIHKAFVAEGIAFTTHGVELRNNSITVIEGDEWFLRLLDDVIFSLEGKPDAELLIECGDERQSPKEVVDRVRQLRDAGIKMRLLVEEGNTHLIGPLNEYRYIPKERFNNYVAFIYGDKFAICTENNTKALVFKDASLATTRRNIFDLLWDVLEKPTMSTADERY